jgi:predicted DNA-binding transcriptional regulator YafY
LITTAIERRRILAFSTSILDSGSSFSVEPYFIAPSREEQCGYLICKDITTGKPRSFRISRLTNVFVTNNTFQPDKKLQNNLYEKALRSPQSVTSSVQAIVKMTSNGIRKFHIITKNRPDIQKIDGELYYFDCPETQLEEYFKRFGEDAIVIEPLSLRSKLKKYYDKAAAAYTE